MDDNAPQNIWYCSLPEGGIDYLAVALMYEGWRLGAWWLDDWYMRVRQLVEADPGWAATLLRWFRLPLLAEKALDEVRAIAESHASEFLPAWLKEDEYPYFKLPDPTEGWLSAIRTIYHDWMPDTHDADKLLHAFGKQDDFWHVAWRLLKVDPRLLHKIMRSALESQPNQIAAKASIMLLRLQIAEAADETQFGVCRRQLLEECAREWHVDTNFIEKGIVERAVASANGEKLTRRDEMNISLALGSESLRRLLAMSLLKSIA